MVVLVRFSALYRVNTVLRAQNLVYNLKSFQDEILQKFFEEWRVVST